jgi:hypothetical protein
MKNTIIILLLGSILILVTILSLHACSCNIEKFETKQVELVVSRYNEDLEWLKNEPYTKYDVIVYNKGPNYDFYKAPNIKKIIQLENVGREGHTYLHHIIHNYADLPDLTVFLPGSLQLEHKTNSATSIFEQIPNRSKSIMTCYGNIYSTEKDFILDDYAGSDENNSRLVKDGTLEQSEHRPFGNWFVHHFGEEAKYKYNCKTFYGVLSVSKEDIQKNTIDYYKKFYEELSFPNPEVGHYIERSWEAIFDIRQ